MLLLTCPTPVTWCLDPLDRGREGSEQGQGKGEAGGRTGENFKAGSMRSFQAPIFNREQLRVSLWRVWM